MNNKKKFQIILAILLTLILCSCNQVNDVELSESNVNTISSNNEKSKEDIDTESVDIETVEESLETEESGTLETIDEIDITDEVVIDDVIIKKGTEELFNRTIYSTVKNNTSATITSYKRAMLAYDSAGNPLKIYWIGLDSSVEESYIHLYEAEEIKIGPGDETEPTGWSLESMRGEEENHKYDEIAYVLYTFKEFTFDNGQKWVNPDYDKWVEEYEGKKIEIDKLDNYYPFVQKVEF